MLRKTALRPFRPPRSSRSFTTRPALRQEQQPQYQAPSLSPEPAQRPNPHREVYTSGGAGRAVAYNFLIAMVTFQALYWSWLKLETIEVKKEKQDEIKSLEGEIKNLTGIEMKRR
ncbi:uncharacterized protein MYCFIDRAFT_212002 [Pseudocercospora fijiensis CIRAD86]|uniref:Uncharacterized protein n=1 Tax=Pseudocercospora fijiensis (strain CIRAD86) TaxID=383855 RepID=M3ASX3_PSEFD|nr:uncharacterized protein MYCFIDRAFT_212002 [Pseudocercospora fijiensis CIRAD86]EME80228.1 hypothetical protein MYCFIDRAFT_212002 [Pseudocercospora fijiensis CIRAD86]